LVALALREAGYVVLPALVVLLALVVFGHLSLGLAILGLIAAGGAALALAAWRVRDLGRVTAWLRHLDDGEEAVPPDIGPPLGELLRPALELARASRRQRGEILGRQALLDSLMAALPDPVLLIDRQRQVRRANPAAERAFGSGIVDVDLARSVRDPGILAALGAALAGGGASSVTFTPAGDRYKHFAARIEPLTLEDGTPGVLMAFREQSEQVIIERMRSDFVANASHEIRTPLASIHGMIETLRGPARDDAEARDSFLETMAQETARMTRLVDDLLSLSRIELAANQPPTEPCDLDGVMAMVTEAIAPVAARRKVRLEVEVPDELPPVKGDADQLHQLLVNLIDNAIKYGDGKPVTVRLTAMAAGPADAGPVAGRPCVEIAVIDRGEGIAREHIPRLTERFYRADKARSRNQGGTGLGLAIVKHIVRRHQGHLAIESEPGSGSRFRVLLPTA
jgi:two-component system phosphate regulon sensor histidine kinase PhoR